MSDNKILQDLSDVEVLQREIQCVKRKSATNCTDCFHCDLLMTDEVILRALNNAIDALQDVDAKNKITRCKDCHHSREWDEEDTLLCYRDELTVHVVKKDAYCDKSQRRYAHHV